MFFCSIPVFRIFLIETGNCHLHCLFFLLKSRVRESGAPAGRLFRREPREHCAHGGSRSRISDSHLPCGKNFVSLLFQPECEIYAGKKCLKTPGSAHRRFPRDISGSSCHFPVQDPVHVRLFLPGRLTIHSHIHRIEVSSRDPAHLGGGCLAFREVFRNDPRHIFTCLGNPFRNDTMIRAHDCQCGPVQFHSRCVPADPRDLYNILLQNSETSDGLRHGIPAFFRKLHGSPVCRLDLIQIRVPDLFDRSFFCQIYFYSAVTFHFIHCFSYALSVKSFLLYPDIC